MIPGRRQASLGFVIKAVCSPPTMRSVLLDIRLSLQEVSNVLRLTIWSADSITSNSIMRIYRIYMIAFCLADIVVFLDSL
jgi:hypothetical protein